MKEIDIEELRNIQIDILDKVDAFCKANDIKYFLVGGTLIGALRHSGYIPWDDDIDIGMLRQDYNKFIEIFMIEGYEIFTANSKLDFYYSFTKVSRKDTLMFEESDLEGYKQLGINIDIFPVDYISDCKEEQRKTLIYIGFWRKLLDVKIMKISQCRIWYKNLVLYLAKFILRKVTVQYIVNEIIKLERTYEHDNVNKAGGLSWVYKGIIDRNGYTNTISVLFENKRYPAPAGYHEYLSQAYGDYMKLPSQDKRKSHHSFRAYWKD